MVNIFFVSDPEWCKFFLNLKPELIIKGAPADIMFRTDRKVRKSLFLAEGSTWHDQRKIISKELHLDVLSSFIEAMDISAMSFIEILTTSSDFQANIL